MKEIKLVIDTDGTFKIFAEGPGGATKSAQDLKGGLEKLGTVIERHVGLHPHGHGHGHGHDHGEHEHAHG